MIRRSLDGAALGMAVLALAGCGGGNEDEDGNVAQQGACALFDGPFPEQEVTDWKSYADHVVRVRVKSGRDEGSEKEPNPVLTLDVQETYWSGQNVPALPARVDAHTSAYMLDDREYVTPLVRLDGPSDDKVWITQGCLAPIPIEDGKLARTEPPGPGYQSLQDRLAGQPPETIRTLMQQAEVRADVRKYMKLRPRERARRVYGH